MSLTRRTFLVRGSRTSLLAAVFAAAQVAPLTACRKEPTDPTAEIRAFIDGMVVAVEARDFGTVNQGLHAEYSDADSNDKASAMALAQALLFRSSGAKITHRTDLVELTGPTEARVEVVAAMADGPITSTTTRAGVYRFKLLLQKVDDKWQVRMNAWERASAVELLGG